MLKYMVKRNNVKKSILVIGILKPAVMDIKSQYFYGIRNIPGFHPVNIKALFLEKLKQNAVPAAHIQNPTGAFVFKDICAFSPHRIPPGNTLYCKALKPLVVHVPRMIPRRIVSRYFTLHRGGGLKKTKPPHTPPQHKNPLF